VKAFLQTLAELRGGKAVDDADRLLREVQERVNETGRPGTLTVSLTVKPASKGNRHMHSVIDKLTCKLPSGESEETLLYVVEEGGYSRRDPRQPELPVLREVTQPPMREEAVSG
jgi:hypothetical protein